MDRQEIFDTVATHLLTQGHKAFDLNCKYHAKNGDKCAIGVLIPDELYDPVIEGFGVASSVSALFRERRNPGNPEQMMGCKSSTIMKILCDLDIKEEDWALLMQLQTTHDLLEPEEWSEALHCIAERFKLSTACMDRELVLA